MKFSKIRSHAKINMALNITGRTPYLHKIESIIAFLRLHDDILIKKSKFKDHKIIFKGKFSKSIAKRNTVSNLLNLLEEKKFLINQKFEIRINKRIPTRAGLGGGSMNAANIFKYLVDKRFIKIKKRKIVEICNLIGSDVILGFNSKNSILTSKNQIKYFKNCKKFYTLVVKPNYGCSTKKIYSKVRKFSRPKLNQPKKHMFNPIFLKKMHNSLEPIVFSKYSSLKLTKLYLENLINPFFVRMTGSGSSLVAYYQSKNRCEKAKNEFNKKYKNYWCIVSKTI